MQILWQSKKIENQDNKCLIHLSDAGKCPNTPEDVWKAALQAIKGKKQSIEGEIIEPVLQDNSHGDNDIGMDSDVAYGSSLSSRKHKALSGLQSWVDNALTPAQQEKVNIKLFQSVEIKSYHCSISTYYQALWLHCPQQRPILSQSELLILWICQLHLSILYTPNLLCAILQHFGIRGCKSPTWGSWATGESQKSNTTLWWMGGWARKEYLWCCQYKCWWISNYTRFGWHDRMMRHSRRLSWVFQKCNVEGGV